MRRRHSENKVPATPNWGTIPHSLSGALELSGWVALSTHDRLAARPYCALHRFGARACEHAHFLGEFGPSGFLALSVLAASPRASNAQVARTEIHPIPTLTLPQHQFLTGGENESLVTIAGGAAVSAHRDGSSTSSHIGARLGRHHR